MTENMFKYLGAYKIGASDTNVDNISKRHVGVSPDIFRNNTDSEFAHLSQNTINFWHNLKYIVIIRKNGLRLDRQP